MCFFPQKSKCSPVLGPLRALSLHVGNMHFGALPLAVVSTSWWPPAAAAQLLVCLSGPTAKGHDDALLLIKRLRCIALQNFPSDPLRQWGGFRHSSYEQWMISALVLGYELISSATPAAESARGRLHEEVDIEVFTQLSNQSCQLDEWWSEWVSEGAANPSCALLFALKPTRGIRNSRQCNAMPLSLQSTSNWCLWRSRPPLVLSPSFAISLENENEWVTTPLSCNHLAAETRPLHWKNRQQAMQCFSINWDPRLQFWIPWQGWCLHVSRSRSQYQTRAKFVS